MHDALRSIAVTLLAVGLLTSAVSGVRWAKRGSPGPGLVLGASMLLLGMIAILLVNLAVLDVDPHIDLAKRYAAAWRSHDPGKVATFYSESGSMAVDDGPPAVGRKAIEAAARSLMAGYPDLDMEFRGVSTKDDVVLYHWTLTGTNIGPRGTGNRVQIRGYDDWKIGADGLIADSKGHTTWRAVTDR